MPELPAFLQEFVNMRKNISKHDTPADKKKLLKGTVKLNATGLDGSSIASIIDKKPPRKVVEEYIQKRLDELSKEKMK